MYYKIKEFSSLTGLPSPTLRYYESEGVLPFVKRDAHGNRLYDDENLAWVDFILALRDTGMSVADIRRYVALYREGAGTLHLRKQMLTAHQAAVREQLAQMQAHFDRISYKLSLYEMLEQHPDRTDIVI